MPLSPRTLSEVQVKAKGETTDGVDLEVKWKEAEPDRGGGLLS